MPKWCITSCFNGWIIFHVLTDFFPQRLASLVNGWMIFQELKNLLYTLVWCLNDLVQLFSMVGSFSMTKMTHIANGWLAQSMVGWFSKIWKTLYKPWLDAQMFYYIFFQWLDHFPCLKWLFSSMVGYFSQWLADFPKIEKPFINHSKMPKCFFTSCVYSWIINMS